MATLRKRGEKWRAEVRLKGIQRSKTFITKAAAKAWASKIETEVEDGVAGKIPNKTFGELLERYAEEKSPKKASHVRERRAINNILMDPVAKVPLREITGADIAAWRDRRLQSVTGSTVNREWNILSHACTIAIKEWGWLLARPTSSAQRPKENAPRTRRPQGDETVRILVALGYDSETPPVTKSARVGAAYLLGIETGMRSGEICGLTKEHVHARYVHLPSSKNGEKRDVPLTKEARRILKQVMEVTTDRKTVFDVDSSTRDALFRKAKVKANVTGLTFHDTRREACTRLAKIYGVMELAKISGHKKLSILLNTYYSPSIDDLADKLE